MHLNFIKSKSLYTIMILLVSCSILIYAYPTGIVGKTLKNGVGCTCHGTNPSTNVIVTINGPDTLIVNETANYSITISGGPLAAGGTNIAASNGILTPGDGLRSETGELTHIQPMSTSNGIVTFNFTYTAPASEMEQTIYANGNSVNLNGFNTGDQWNFAPNKTIVVQSVTGVNNENIISSYKLKQNYPNPFNPSTRISFEIPQSENVKLVVYNSAGQEVKTLINEFMTSGNHFINFNASNIASGVYYYRISTPHFYEIKKMILMK